MAAKTIEKAELRVRMKRPGRRNPSEEELRLIKWFCKELKSSTRTLGRYSFDFMEYNGTDCEPYIRVLLMMEKHKIRSLKKALRSLLAGL